LRRALSAKSKKSSNFKTACGPVLLFLIAAVLFQAGEACATGFIKIGDRARVSDGKEIADVVLVSETVDIKFDNQMSKTRVVQVFKNNTSRILEGQYIFPLPFGANIISFATWDDGVKINGVIMEKVKAKKIYDDIVSQMKDPGLLENIGSNTFSAKIFPIPAYGTKRLEMEYVEYLPLLNRLYSFTYPLYSEDLEINARSLSINVELSSDFTVVSPLIYFKNTAFVKNSAGSYSASYAAPDFNDKIDFKATFSLDLAESASKTISCIDEYKGSEEVYFLTSFRPFENETQEAQASADGGRKAFFLIDKSFSMRGDKLEIIKKLFSNLQSLEGYTGFNAIFFDSRTGALSPDFLNCDEAGFSRLRSRIEKIRPFGASRPSEAVREFIKMCSGCGSEVNAILISDGLYPAAEGSRPLVRTLGDMLEANPQAQKKLTISALAAGTGCENDRLSMVSNTFMGEFREVKNPFDNDAQLIIASILKSMAGGIFKNVGFKCAESPSGLYPKKAQNVNYDSECYAVGKLDKKSDISLDIEYEFRGSRGAKKIKAEAVKGSKAWYVPLLWARQRVNYLTARIEEEGENEDMRKEIVELSKRFNFVTKFTSFLAVPPSVLRPRRIKPGDPEITITAARDSKLVAVKLPFTEALKAEYDEAKGAFVARFTAPAHVKDGRYEARVMIVDKFNREKHHVLDFYIDSTPPVIYAKCLPEKAARGTEMKISVNASPDTASIKAKMPDGEILNLKYDNLSRLSHAFVKLSDKYAPGDYNIEIEAIDHAANRSVKFIKFTLLPQTALLNGAADKSNSTAGDGNAR